MPPEDRIRVEHMIDAAEHIARFVAGRRRDDLDRDVMLLFAIVRALEVIGEAASKVDATTQLLAQAIPWRAIVGMRNRVVHAYFDIDTAVVWKTATEEIPALLPLLQALRDALPEGSARS